VPCPKPTSLFHITAIDNLQSIAGSALLSKNKVAAQAINFANIAFSTS
jgi:ssDNA thymidine ADP-ribosyltransferase, DarT